MLYNEYTKKMLEDGFESYRKIFTQKDLNIETFSCKKGTLQSQLILLVKCPYKSIISLCGTNLISKNDIITKAYKIRLKLYDENNVELPPDTKIRILKENSGNNSYITPLERIQYNVIKDSYEFEHGFELGRWDNDHEYLCIRTVSPKLNIDKNKTELEIELDVWSKK